MRSSILPPSTAWLIVPLLIGFVAFGVARLRPPSNGIRKIQPEPVPSASTRPCGSPGARPSDYARTEESQTWDEFVADCRERGRKINCWSDGLCDCADWERAR